MLGAPERERVQTPPACPSRHEAFHPPPSPTSSMPTSTLFCTTNKTKRPRPKGLWVSQVTQSHRPARHRTPSPALSAIIPLSGLHSECCSDHEEELADSPPSTPSKRARYSTESSEETASSGHCGGAAHHTPRVSGWTKRTKIMDTTTTARRGSQTGLKSTCDFEDWEDLKDLFQKAAEQYESDDTSEALALLRGVIHECHRFLLHYQDPSVLFSAPSPREESETPPDLSPSEEKLRSEWSFENIQSDSISHKSCHHHRHVSQPQPPLARRKCKCRELPTAFHAILGSTLFLFGNLIAQDPNVALEGEPNTPIPYWLAALDVFETGENLPKRTDGRSTCDAPEDWRMAIVWGRTLVCIAEEAIERSKDSPAFTAEEPAWPKESPFSVIAARRPPITLRMSLAGATANDLMILAMDQFSRGIFHMPHPLHATHAQPPPDGAEDMSTAPPTSATATDNFSRAKELYTVAHEVLLLAEKLTVPRERQYWASWADSVFEQMRMEADMDNWRGPITRMRGKCWLTYGSARLDEIEARLQEAHSDAESDAVLASESAVEARHALEKAMEFFERALELSSRPDADMDLDPTTQERDALSETKDLLLEAVLPLLDLTPDKSKRDELYARAVRVGGEDVVRLLQGDPMDEDED